MQCKIVNPAIELVSNVLKADGLRVLRDAAAADKLGACGGQAGAQQAGQAQGAPSMFDGRDSLWTAPSQADVGSKAGRKPTKLNARTFT